MSEQLDDTEVRVERAIEAIAAGGMVIVVDDADRENEGDLIMAAEWATPEALAFIVRHGSGIVCVSMQGERLEQLQLPLLTEHGTEVMDTAFTLTVDARHGTTTGVSAADRARTIRALIAPDTELDDLRRPGHVFPLRSKPGGVLERAGHTEAALDLARLAGLYPAGVLCEVVNDDGTMARLDDLEGLAAIHHLPLVSVAELIAYRSRREQLVQRGPRAHSRPPRATSTRSRTARTTAGPTSPSCAAMSRTPATCWCASTRSASPETSSAAPAASAGRSSSDRSS